MPNMVRQLCHCCAFWHCKTTAGKVTLHHQHHTVNGAVRNKLLMLFVPFLKSWTYTRTREQVRQMSLLPVRYA